MVYTEKSDPHPNFVIEKNPSKIVHLFSQSYKNFNFFLSANSLKKPSDKQFSYRKLTNENSFKGKPLRPPQPKFETNREGVLIDLNTELSLSRQSNAGSTDSRSVSILDEPIDVMQECVPPPYQQPPSYYNTKMLEVTDDPFDTSRVYSPEPQQPYSQIPVVPQNNEVKNGYIKGDIANRSFNYTTKNDIQVATSKGVSATPKEVATEVSLMNLNELPSDPDKNFVQQLENYLLSKTEIPLLPPPKKPESVLPKIQNGTYSNLDTYKKSNYDTTNVFNKIWYENMTKENGNVKECKNFSDIPNSSQNFYHHYDPVSDFDRLSISSANFYNNCHADNLYNNTQPSSSSSCNTQLAVYSSYNSIRQYSEVAESVYSEIAENSYSQVPEESLKPHRPAPPSPMVQSMQQIQRKIQQGQVTNHRGQVRLIR